MTEAWREEPIRKFPSLVQALSRPLRSDSWVFGRISEDDAIGWNWSVFIRCGEAIFGKMHLIAFFIVHRRAYL